MKDTGVIRKIDDLGRIVIPKEIRKKLKLREGDNLEIYVKEDGQILLKKYAPMGEVMEVAAQCANALNSISDLFCVITDTERVIAVSSGGNKQKYLDKQISNNIIDILDSRKEYLSKKSGICDILENDEYKEKYASEIIIPIISDGEALGTVSLISFDTSRKADEKIDIARIISLVISNYLSE